MKKLFFALITSFLFVATSWGQCEKTLQDKEFTLGLGKSKTYEITENGYNYVSLFILKTGILNSAIGSIYVELYGENQESIGTREIKVSELKQKEYTETPFEIFSNNNAFIKKVIVNFPMGGSYERKFKQLIAKKNPVINIIPTAPINFVNGAGTHTINIEYSALTSNLTARLEKQDGVISLGVPTGTSINSVNIASAGCSYGTVPLTISYNPTNCKDYTNKIIFSNGTTIDIKGTYERSFTIDTEDIKFPTVELGGTAARIDRNVSYSYNPENITATFESADTPFSLSSEILAEACAKSSKTLTISFNPQKVGPYTNVIKLSNGSSINISGECSKKIDTKLEVLKESYTSVSLGWTKVDDATAYRVIENTTGVSYIVEGNVTSYNFRGLHPNTSYSFTLYALFDGVASLNSSNIVTAKTLKTDAPIQDCTVYENAGEKSLMASTDEEIIYDFKKDNSESLVYTKRVEFEARMRDATVLGVTYPATVSPGEDMMLYVKLEGKSEFEKFGWNAHNAGITESYKKFTVEIPYNTVAIRFFTGTFNGGCWREVKNLKVYKDRKLDAYLDEKLEKKAEELDFGIVEPNASVSKTLYVKYVHAVLASDVTYDNGMRVVVEDGLGHYKVEYDQKNPCAEGSQAVKVTFTPTNCTTDYNATLTLLNGETIEVKLTGTLKRNPGTVNKITWTGAEDTNWDNRDNWTKENGSVLSAADVLSEDLLVVIPAEKERYPVIPDVHDDTHFKTNRDKDCACTQINAGDNATATKIAHKIVLEQGASIVGVETLYNPSTGVRRYHEVENQFDARRQDWLLVGTVVKPWDESGNGEVRNILSEDYFLGHFPQVYMHEAVIDQENHVTWQQSFTDLNKEVPKNKAFAIYVANEYGAYYFPAETFDYYNGTSYAATLAHPHRYTFTGHFYNESSVITYDNLTPNQPVLLCNTYPAAIDAYALNNAVNGTIEYYDYTTSKSFTDANKEGAVILPQNGFVFTPGDGVTSLTIGAEYMLTGGTTSRSTIATPTSCRIKASNAAQAVSSEISIQYDQEKEDVADFSIDAPKLFAKETYGLPDVYVRRHDANWADITIPNMTEPIPLGVTINGSDQTFTLEMTQNNMPYTWVLEDRATSTMYNLSNGEVCTVSGLKNGDNKGRFYLHATPIQTEEDNELTNIDEELAQNNNIDIFVQEGTVIVSATQEAKLQSIVVSDMVGRSTTYTVNDQYAEISLPKSKGIYIINVVGEAGIATKKVRL